MKPDTTIFVTWLQKLSADIDTMLRLLGGHSERVSPDQWALFHVDLNPDVAKFLQRRQGERLHAFGLQTNALVALRGNRELGGRVQVNTRYAELSPAEYPFLLVLAEEMLTHLDSRAQLGTGFVTKDVLVERVQEQLRARKIRTSFRPEPEHVRIYIRRIRQKLHTAGIDSRLIETQTRIGGYRLSTLPEHIAITQEDSHA